MKPLLLIYNPNAGKGHIGSYLSEILQIFTSHGWVVSCYPTKKKRDAYEFVTTYGDKFQRVVCAGGDGTLSETAEGLLSMENPPPLAYIPFGSTNDSANTFKLPRDPLMAAFVAATGRPLPQDTGLFNGHPFIYVAAFGAFTSVSYEVSQEIKNTFGNLAYVMGGAASIPSISPYRFRVEYDGKVIEDDFFYGMVCNTYTVGGLTAISQSTAQLDDGHFEVVLVRKADGLTAVLAALQSFLWKIPFEEDSNVLSFQAKEIRFISEKPVCWTIDGEFGGEGKDYTIKNVHRSLKIVHGATNN